MAVLIIVSFFILSPRIDELITSIVQKPLKNGDSFTNRDQCEKEGGDWGKAGLFPKELCRLPHKDAGTFCIAGFQCQSGQCLSAYDFRKQQVLAVGKCAKYRTTFGCSQEVHFGIVSHAVCRD